MEFSNVIVEWNVTDILKRITYVIYIYIYIHIVYDRWHTQHLANQNFALFVAIRNAAVAQEIPQQFLESTAIAKVFPHVSF